jgi:hypothetical protein
MVSWILTMSEGGGTRTHDLGIKSPLLYQLSYAPEPFKDNELAERAKVGPISMCCYVLLTLSTRLCQQSCTVQG